MHHVTNIGLVDAHAECHGCHHDIELIFQEAVLNIAPLLLSPARMIRVGIMALESQTLRHLIDPSTAAAIDDATGAILGSNELT